MSKFFKWPLQSTATGGFTGPDALISAPLGLPALGIPPEVGLLLLNAGGAQEVVAALGDVRTAGLGLFLADPNLVPAQFALQIARCSDWVCNFPSVGQHEHEVRRYLDEVDLGYVREMHVLAELGAAGLSTIATISTPSDAAHACAARPTALLVMPPLADYTGGSVPLEKRIALERAIASTANGVPLIGLREAGEDVYGLAACLRPPAEVSQSPNCIQR